MEAQVEIYEIEADPIGTAQDIASLRELHKRAGADGQDTLLPVNDEMRPNRFPLLKQSELNVIRVLCPTQVKLKEYSNEAIPRRVLELAAKVNEAGLFDKGLYVNHNAGKSDPFLIGKRQDPESSWRTNNFLLARWDDELCSWNELVERARKVLKRRISTELIAGKKEIEALQETMDVQISQALEDGVDLSVSISIHN